MRFLVLILMFVSLTAGDEADQPAVVRPAWATAHGRDQFGTWADLTVGKQVQRFRYILPGTFTMGSPVTDEGRRADEVEHQVTLTRPFWLADSEVTQATWVAVGMTNTGYFADRKTALSPVNMVSWIDCRLFLDRLNQQVPDMHATFPTEAQWEYACRAGTTGQQYGEIEKIAWTRDNSGGWPGNAVKKKEPNAWGLHDTIGGVWEWCADWSADYGTKPVTDPVGGHSGTARIARGGGANNDPQAYRAAFRLRYPADFRFHDLGLRICVPTTPPIESATKVEAAIPVIGNGEFLADTFKYMRGVKGEPIFFLGKESQKWFKERLVIYHPAYAQILAEMKSLLKVSNPGLDLMYLAEDTPTHVSYSDTSTLHLDYKNNLDLPLAQAALRIAAKLAPGRLCVHANSKGGNYEHHSIFIGYSAWMSPWHPPIAPALVERLLTEPKNASEFHDLLARQPLLPEIEKEVHPPLPAPGLVMRFDLARSRSDFDNRGYLFNLDKAELTPDGVFINGVYAAWIKEQRKGEPMQPFVDCPDLDPLRFTVSALLAPSGDNPMRGNGDTNLLFCLGGEGTWLQTEFDVSRKWTRNALIVGFNNDEYKPMFPHEDKTAMAKIVGNARWYALTLAVELRSDPKTITVYLNGLKSLPIELPKDALPWVVRQAATSRNKRFKFTNESNGGNFRGIVAALSVHNGLVPEAEILALHAKWDEKKRVMPDHPDFGDRRGQPVKTGSNLKLGRAVKNKPSPIPTDGQKPAPPKENVDDF